MNPRRIADLAMRDFLLELHSLYTFVQSSYSKFDSAI